MKLFTYIKKIFSDNPFVQKTKETSPLPERNCAVNFNGTGITGTNAVLYKEKDTYRWEEANGGTRGYFS